MKLRIIVLIIPILFLTGCSYFKPKPVTTEIVTATPAGVPTNPRCAPDDAAQDACYKDDVLMCNAFVKSPDGPTCETEACAIAEVKACMTRAGWQGI